MLKGFHGRWSARVLREAAAERRIDPQAPTPGTVAVSMSPREVVDLHGHGLRGRDADGDVVVVGVASGWRRYVWGFGPWMLALAWMAGRDVVALPRRVGAGHLRGIASAAHGLELLAMTYETAAPLAAASLARLGASTPAAVVGPGDCPDGGDHLLPLPFGTVLPSMSLIVPAWAGCSAMVWHCWCRGVRAGAILYLITLWQVVEHLLRSWIRAGRPHPLTAQSRFGAVRRGARFRGRLEVSRRSSRALPKPVIRAPHLARASPASWSSTSSPGPSSNSRPVQRSPLVELAVVPCVGGLTL